MKTTNKALVTLLLILGLAATTAGNALANVAANTQIINSATLSYDDGTGTPKTSTTRVTVTVSLVPADPLIIPLANQTTSYTPGAILTNTFIVRAAANGPDNYDLVTAITKKENTDNPTAPTVTITSDNTIRLGATVTLAGSTISALIVPADGVDNDDVNGIKKDDTIYLDGATREVLSVVDNLTGTSTINLKADLPGLPDAGLLVMEQQNVTVDVTPGTIGELGKDVIVEKNLTATSQTDNSKTTTSATSIKDTFTSGAANLTKFVRNVPTPGHLTVTVGSDPYTFGGNVYYQSAVNAEPNATLEYILVASNTSATAVNNAKVVDILPTDFVILKQDVYGTAEIRYYDDTLAITDMSAAATDDPATFDSGTKTLTVFIGTGADFDSGGTIPGNTSLHALYQVTVKP